MSQVVLLTGATGNIGAPLLHRLLAAPEVGKVIAIVRGESLDVARRRVAHAVETATGRACSEEAFSKLETVAGDITCDHLGLEPDHLRAVARKVTHIIHSAAQTQFTLPLECARAVNCTGTQNIVSLARLAMTAGWLQRMVHVSTAYVCGNASGVISEDWTPAPEFADTYEQTKSETEAWLRQYATDLPLTIVRPTIVIGDSQTGRINTFNVLYTPLRLILRGAMPVPASAIDTPLDVVSVDYVVRAIEYLAFCAEPLRTPIHLAAGSSRTMTVGGIIEAARRCAESNGYAGLPPKHSHRPSSMEIYDSHMILRRQFATTLSDRLLAPAGIVPTPLSEYFPIAMDYALKTRWGKQPVVPTNSRGDRALCAA